MRHLSPFHNFNYPPNPPYVVGWEVINARLWLLAASGTRGPHHDLHHASRTRPHAPFFHSSISLAVSIMIRCYTRLVQVVSENHATTSHNKRGLPLLTGTTRCTK